jgi:transposase-like protein
MVSFMPKTRPAYPPEFGREAVQMLRAGRTPRELSESLGVSEQTLRNWRRQDQVDRHERDDGRTTDERDELQIPPARASSSTAIDSKRPCTAQARPSYSRASIWGSN